MDVVGVYPVLSVAQCQGLARRDHGIALVVAGALVLVLATAALGLHRPGTW